MKAHRFLLPAALLASLPLPAAAKPAEAIDPAKAYVVVELGQVDGAMIAGSISLARYDEERKDLEQLRPTRPNARQVTIYRADKVEKLGKDDKRRLVMVVVQPGLWVVEGVNDTAFSLGSSTLRLEGGSVVDLGVANIYTDFPEGEKRDVLTMGRMMKGAMLGGLIGGGMPKPMPKAVDFRARTGTDLPLPAYLATRAQPVAWTGEVRFGNYLGGLVNRMGGRKARNRAMIAAQAAEAQAEVAEPQPAEPQPAEPQPAEPQPATP